MTEEYDYQRLQPQTFADYMVALNISYEQERSRINGEGGGRTMVIYRHISGVKGTFYKRYRPTGLSYYYIMVDTFDGRKFYAPEKEWEILK